MPKNDKITWGRIIEDFKNRHPRLAKNISYWVPCGIATIEIHIRDGMVLEYNYDFHKAVIKQEERE